MFGIWITLFVFLIVLWLLFVFSFYIEIIFTLDYLKIKIFRITFINMKEEKYLNLVKKLLPKDKEYIKKEIDYSSLAQFVHFDLVHILIRKKIEDYPEFVFTNSTINILNEIFQNELRKYIRSYQYEFKANDKDDIKVISKIHFNIGTLLINYLIIKRKYKHEKQ